MIKVDSNIYPRICQGDIISNVEFIEYADEKDGQIEISKILFPFVYVLTQDCDLEQDYTNRTKLNPANNDKNLISVIVAPLYNIEHVYNGEQLSELGLKMQIINKKLDSSDNKLLRQNKNVRYHFLEFPSEISLPNSVIDFKHYFTVNILVLNNFKSKNFICKVSELYRADISHRFSYFLSRIGLPEIL